jgi:hypothetical protein
MGEEDVIKAIGQRPVETVDAGHAGVRAIWYIDKRTDGDVGFFFTDGVFRRALLIDGDKEFELPLGKPPQPPLD